jgi:hypothetical protein
LGGVKGAHQAVIVAVRQCWRSKQAQGDPSSDKEKVHTPIVPVHPAQGRVRSDDAV